MKVKISIVRRAFCVRPLLINVGREVRQAGETISFGRVFILQWLGLKLSIITDRVAV